MDRSIVLAPRGSLGDVHPFLGVALGLKQRGHRVVLATASDFRSKVESEGIEFVAVRPDRPTSAIAPRLNQRPGSAAEFFLRQWLLPHLEESYADLLPACQGADLIVAGMVAYAVPLVAEQLKVPWLSMVLQPLAFWSTYDPPLLPFAPWLYSLQKLGRWPSSMLLALKTAQTRHWAEPIDSLRRKLGLGPAVGHPLTRGMLSPFGTLAAFSRAFAREQPDWPQPTWITGFAWYDQRQAGEMVPLELQEFLLKGDAPIVFTLGDMAAVAPGDFYEQSREAVLRLGCRAVFLAGKEADRLRRAVPAERICVEEYAPYSQVFPHAAGVVHAGGIGTIALALRARCPMLLVPLAFDQADNSERARRLGVARVLGRRRYTAGRACHELQALLSNASYARRAAQLGSLLDAENGVETACDRIETVARERAYDFMPTTVTKT